MKTITFILSLFILSVSALAYVKIQEKASCEKTCCTKNDAQKTKSNGCCGDICSPFMKCQSSQLVAFNFQTMTNIYVSINHKAPLKDYFLDDVLLDLWQPPKI
jgi:hypothetical protein